MKPEYIEGRQATANFEEFATAILQANPKKKTNQQVKKSPSQKKSKKSDKD